MSDEPIAREWPRTIPAELRSLVPAGSELSLRIGLAGLSQNLESGWHIDLQTGSQTAEEENGFSLSVP